MEKQKYQSTFKANVYKYLLAMAVLLSPVFLIGQDYSNKDTSAVATAQLSNISLADMLLALDNVATITNAVSTESSKRKIKNIGLARKQLKKIRKDRRKAKTLIQSSEEDVLVNELFKAIKSE